MMLNSTFSYDILEESVKLYLPEVFNMKKLFVFITFLMILLLAGCGNQADVTQPIPTVAPTEPTTPSITAPTQDNISTDVPPSYENMYSVALPVNIENRYMEDGTLVSQYASQSMDLIIPDSDVAQKIKNDFYDRIEKYRFDSESLHELARSMYKNGTLQDPLAYNVHYDVTRIDQGVLSLFGQLTQSGEGAHANVPNISVNYNLVSGDILTLGGILYHADCKSTLADLVISGLEKMKNEIDLYQEYASTVRNDFAKDESKFDSFYFSTTGLCFYFPQYKIAPRAYGTIVVELPYHELTGVIGDEFFPVERTYAKGEIIASAFTTEEWEKYDQFAQIITAESGNSRKILLTVDSAVQNVRIYEVIRQGMGDAITQTKNIFASNILSPNEAILFEADFTYTPSRYVLAYTSDGTTQFYYFTLNTENQTITLSYTNDPIKVRSGA